MLYFLTWVTLGVMVCLCARRNPGTQFGGKFEHGPYMYIQPIVGNTRQ